MEIKGIYNKREKKSVFGGRIIGLLYLIETKVSEFSENL